MGSALVAVLPGSVTRENTSLHTSTTHGDYHLRPQQQRELWWVDVFISCASGFIGAGTLALASEAGASESKLYNFLTIEGAGISQCFIKF